jgi:hypothetical protein
MRWGWIRDDALEQRRVVDDRAHVRGSRRKAHRKIESIIAGSVNEKTMASRLLPIPPKADPASMPASMRKKVPTVNNETTVMTSPAKLSGTRERKIGTNKLAARVEANRM